MTFTDETRIEKLEEFPSRTDFDASFAPVQPTTRLHAEAAEVLNGTVVERTRVVLKDRLIRYPAMIAIQQEAEWLFHEPRRVRARGLVVSSKAGNGKSSLAQAIHRRLSGLRGESLSGVLTISIAGVRDARAVYGRIMEELGSPARVSHRMSDREMVVTRLLRAVDCRLMILDEVQDVLLGTEREQRRALEAIKFLMNELSLPILAFGTERAADGFSSDAHLAARFAERSLPRWKPDDTLANFLGTYERFLPLPEPSELGSAEKVEFLSKIGNGVLDAIVQRVQNAALHAIASGAPRVTLALLEQATSRPGPCPIGQSERSR